MLMVLGSATVIKIILKTNVTCGVEKVDYEGSHSNFNLPFLHLTCTYDKQCQTGLYDGPSMLVNS